MRPAFTRSWWAGLRPEWGWRGPRALLPVATCYRILDTVLWLAGTLLALALGMISFRAPGLRHGAWILLPAGLNIGVLLAAVFRGWPFLLRFAILAVELLVVTAGMSAWVGLSPNWAILVMLLVTLTTIFLGTRAGLLTIAGLMVAHGLIAWAWVVGWLPAQPGGAEVMRTYQDYTVATVWIRVLALASGLLGAMVLILRQLFGARQESEAFAQAILDSVTAHIAVLDQNGVIVAVNRPWMQFALDNAAEAGVPPAHVGLGVNYLTICRADLGASAADAIAAHDGIRSVIERRVSSFTLEYRCDSPTEPRWFVLDATPLENPGNFLVVSHTDITARRKAEQTLRASEARLAKVFHSSPVGINIFRLSDGKSIEANDAFLEIVGYARAEFIGRTADELGLFPDQASRAERLRLLREGKVVRNQDTQVRRRNGEIRDILGSIEVTEVDGQPVGLVFAADITERKRAERARRLGEEKFRTMFEMASIGMARADARDGRLLQVNLKMCDITGYSAAELLELRFAEFTHPDDRSTDWECFQRLVRGEINEYRVEKRYVRKDGAIAWVSVNVTVVREAEGDQQSTMAMIEDITERRRGEEALRESETALKLFRTLMERSSDQIYVLQPKTGRFLDANETAWVALGYAREELLALTIFDIVVIAPAVFAAVAGRLRATGHVTLEARHRRKDATTYPVEVSLSLVALDREYILASIRDITERNRAEAHIREQAHLLDLASDAIMVRDLTGCVRYWNEGSARMLGWSAEEVLGRNVDERLQVAPAVQAAIRAALRRHGEWSGEITVVTKAGRMATLFSRCTVMRGAQREAVSLLVINTDITAKKALESQALRAQRLEAIGTLSSGIAHDLNNILAPMLMASGLLQDSLTHPEDLELMKLIEHSAQRGAAIIRQLLTFSRGIEGERVPLQLRPLIREMAGIALETFPRNIQLTEGAAADLWPVLADTTQIHQVLMNLCVNARDAMPEGGELRITAENVATVAQPPRPADQPSPGPYVLVTVGDSGRGIPRVLMDRIFEPFFTTKGVGEGTGLGLSTVLGIVRSHQGFIAVESEPGRGSTFRVYLPAVPAAAVVSAAPPGAPAQPGAGETILVVDDELAILVAVRHCLESAGYRVVTAREGREALEVFAAQAGRLKLVVTDVMMPGMDGLKLARGLRARDPGIRVIASSGLDQTHKSGELAEGIIVDVLNKPYERATLLAAVQRHLRVVPS